MNATGSIEVFFRYSNGDLKIRLTDASLQYADDNVGEFRTMTREDFPGYSRFKLWKIKRNGKSTKEAMESSYRFGVTGKFIALLDKVVSGISAQPVAVPETFMAQVTRELAWYSVKLLLEEPEINPTYQKMVEYRDFFNGNLETLQEVTAMAIQFRVKAEKWKVPICFPDILGREDDLVLFENLMPVHLISELKPEQLVPLNYLPALNGNMFVFTGQNAGGKSAAEETIVNAIYMAQSGFPVFGDKFSLNLKTKIGMAFLERGSGSTMEMLLKKTKAILEGLKDAPPNGVVIILDEVGTGTQEGDGLEYGRRLLTKLAEHKCSVITSTQITDLARYARTELNAHCFKFDLNHSIAPGIGTGGIDKLMAEIGLDKMLN